MTLRSLRFFILFLGICIVSRAEQVDAPIEIIANVQGVEKQPDPLSNGVAVWLKIQSPAPLKGIVFVLDSGIADSAAIDARFHQGNSFVFLVPEPLAAGIWRVKRYSDNMSKPGVKFIATDLAAVPYIELAKDLIEEASKLENVDVFPALLVQLFAGPRRSEIPHITWDLIKDRYLRFDITKVRAKRPVELPGVLLEWLAPYRRSEGRLFAPPDAQFNPKDTRPIEDSFTYRLMQVADAAKIALPKNVLRHTAITYRVNSTEDISATALWAGNSVNVIREHYLGAATKDEAKAFYSLRPIATNNVVSIA